MIEHSKIEDIIDSYKAKDIHIGAMHFKESYIGSDGNRRIYNWDSLVDKYLDVIKNSMIPVVLTEKELNQYRYRPRQYCHEVYGDVELWFILLRVNNMLTSSDFNRLEFYTFTTDTIEVLKEILLIEDKYLTENRIESKGL